jgi:hypothetical protein
MVLGRMVDDGHDISLRITNHKGHLHMLPTMNIMEILGLKVVMVGGGSFSNELKFEKMVDVEFL